VSCSRDEEDAAVALTEAELVYLAGRDHGRLATLAPNGTPQNKPVGFRYNAELGTIDISGYNMETSAKFRNIQIHPHVAFVVDDVIGEGMFGTRFLEIRGTAEAVTLDEGAGEGLSTQIIRIRPRRVVGWNVQAGNLGLHVRDVAG
jgi:pyridoxamine 5'-phosphate oxidase family protein